MFVVAANPVLHVLAGVALGHLDPVMRAADADALFREAVDQFGSILLDGRVAAAAVGVDQHGIDPLECCVILGPAEIMHLSLDPLNFIEAFLQEQ